MPSRERKIEYFARAKQLFTEYRKILIVGANNVGSRQFQHIRQALRGKAVVLMGKNTMMRRIISEFIEENGGEHPVSVLKDMVVGNIGFIYTNEDLGMIKDVIEANRVPAAAKAGQVAEEDVIVPPGPTGCDPGQTQWFQALNVPTKISKGQIEIISELKLIPAGSKVGSSEAALLQKLDMRPFTFGLVLKSVYDNGAVFDAKVLAITPELMREKFNTAVRNMASVCLAAGYPTVVSLPHSVGNGVRTILAIAAASGYTFPQMAEWDALLGVAAPAAEEEAAAEE